MSQTTIMVVAGEASGDNLAAPLISELKQAQPDLHIIGVGGEKLEAVGLESIFPMSELSVMGFVEVLPQLPKLLKRADELVAAAKENDVKLIITVDAQDFNRRLAKRMKHQLGIPTVHIVAPTVWAWRASRAKVYADIYDELFTLFPFEPPYFTKHGLNTTYLGHPLVAELAEFSHQIKADIPTKQALGLLPGSRVGEIKRVFPTLLRTWSLLSEQQPNLTALVPVASPELRPLLESMVEDAPRLELVELNRYEALQNCRAAIACSGTVNLELALLGVPTVVVYQMAPLTFQILKQLVDVPYISPVNWIAEEKVLPEFIQNEAEPTALAAAVMPLLEDTLARQAQVRALATVREKLQPKEDPTKLFTAQILPYLSE